MILKKLLEIRNDALNSLQFAKDMKLVTYKHLTKEKQDRKIKCNEKICEDKSREYGFMNYMVNEYIDKVLIHNTKEDIIEMIKEDLLPETLRIYKF